jgi:penicillin-binding protein 1A
MKKALRRSVKTGLFVFFFVLVPICGGIVAGGMYAFMKTVPSIADLRSEITPPSTRIYSADDTLIGELKIRKGKYVPYAKMPPDLIKAVVAVEDSNFWSHGGIDYMAIVRAASKDILKGHLKEGGSTITQQLAKIAFLNPEKTFRRKLREFFLARRIEQTLTKEQIIELYLNRAYLGHGAYGVEMAAREYFSKPVGELSTAECALLAGLLKAPSTYSPVNDMARAKERQETVLARMEEEGFLNRRQREEVVARTLVLNRPEPQRRSVNYFIEYVKRELLDRYGEEAVYQKGLNVHTTLDLRAQVAAVDAVQRGLRDLDKRRGWRGPVGKIDPRKAATGADRLNGGAKPAPGDIVRGVVTAVAKDSATIQAGAVSGILALKDAAWAANLYDPETNTTIPRTGLAMAKLLSPGDIVLVRVLTLGPAGEAAFALEQEPEGQGALVAIEPRSGQIRALVGGYDFARSEYNRAIDAHRQPGSAFKPIVYALALSYGYTPATVIMDEEIEFKDEESVDETALGQETEAWKPRNYDEEFKGETNLRDALAFSRNVVTVKVVDNLGIQRIIDFARKIGIRSDIQRDLTVALGSLSVTPLELTVSYSAFANGGVRVDPIAITYVTDSRGRLIDRFRATESRVMDEQNAFLMNSMLKDVVAYGTGWRARALKRPVAGKTGTTNEYRDAWFLGYSTDMIAGVWVGMDDMRSLGKDETGSRAACPIWVDFMGAVSRGSEVRDFPRPEGIVSRLIDPKTGLLADKWTDGAMNEVFKQGTEPTEYTPSIWQVREPDNLLLN